jgi:hypothetical protein
MEQVAVCEWNTDSQPMIGRPWFWPDAVRLLRSDIAQAQTRYSGALSRV